MRKSLALYTLAVTLVGCTMDPSSRATPTNQPPWTASGNAAGPDGSLETNIDFAIKRWTEYFAATKPEFTDDAITKLMKGKFRDRATFYLGGTGDYYSIYIVDDFVQVRIHCNRHGDVYAMPLAERRVRFLRDPHGDWMLPLVTD